MEILNVEDRDYYEGKLYKVSLWNGMGYNTYEYIVYAGGEQEALELAVMYAERKDDPVLFDYWEIIDEADNEEDSEEYLDENYIYIDATMLGANEPWFVLRENTRVEEIKEEN